MRKLFFIILFILLVVLAVTLNLKNDQLVTLDYYAGLHWEGPIAWLLTLTFSAGLIVGALFMSLSVFKNKRNASKTRRKLEKVEKEVENLRTMPIKDDV